MSGTSLDEDTRLDESTSIDSGWQTVVWDDPVNLMSYVTHVFRTYFGFSRERAAELMMQVHTEGRAVVHEGPREIVERHVEAMHAYGLQATVEKSPQ